MADLSDRPEAMPGPARAVSRDSRVSPGEKFRREQRFTPRLKPRGVPVPVARRAPAPLPVPAPPPRPSRDGHFVLEPPPVVEPTMIIELPPPPSTRAAPGWRGRWPVAAGFIAGAVTTGAALLLSGAASMPGSLAVLSAPPAAPALSAPPSDPGQRAAYYLERAKTGDSAAQLQLAVTYAKGDGVAQDYAKAATWFTEAAKSGVVRAQYDLAVLYERGRGVPEDMSQALAWYRKAAQADHPLAQFNLAVAYSKGRGGRQDYAEAALWYRRAAAHGITPAMFNLAILYDKGLGLEASTPDAFAWYQAAAKRGDKTAEKRAGELAEQFSTLEKERALALANDVEGSIRDEPPEAAAAARLAGSDSGAPGSSTTVLRSGLVREP